MAADGKRAEEDDFAWMRLACELAGKCEKSETAYSVGAVLVKEGKVLSTGFSREMPGNTHAEECALRKVDADPELHPLSDAAVGATMYTTMEPCSERLSGKLPCTDRLLKARVARVVVGIREPTKFVICEGTRKLRDAGVEVVYLEDDAIESAARAPNRHLFPSEPSDHTHGS